MQTVKSSARTRAESNRRNGQNSTGPTSAEGKAKVAANALKDGFFANINTLNPADAPAYQQILSDLRAGFQPANLVEDHLVREVAMLSARLQRIEAAEFSWLSNNTASDPTDEAEIAGAYQSCIYALERLSKIETQLRRAYNRSWDRLERMQKERRSQKEPMRTTAPAHETQTAKQSQSVLTRGLQTDDARLAGFKRRLDEIELDFPEFDPRAEEENSTVPQPISRTEARAEES